MLWGSITGGARRAVHRRGAECGSRTARGERADRARRQLLSAIASARAGDAQPGRQAVGRGAPAVSRSVDTLVRAGLVERTQDPNNRRRLALRLTERGREGCRTARAPELGLQRKLERLAQASFARSSARSKSSNAAYAR